MGKEGTAAVGKIEDFGEEIKGALKMLYGERMAGQMGDMAEEDIARKPFAQSWPQPDYQKMLDERTPAETVSLMRALREAIEPKPQARHAGC